VSDIGRDLPRGFKKTAGWFPVRPGKSKSRSTIRFALKRPQALAQVRGKLSVARSGKSNGPHRRGKAIRVSASLRTLIDLLTPRFMLRRSLVSVRRRVSFLDTEVSIVWFYEHHHFGRVSKFMRREKPETPVPNTRAARP
jgi:hypothetical protein